jgi:hypothetical protein
MYQHYQTYLNGVLMTFSGGQRLKQTMSKGEQPRLLPDTTTEMVSGDESNPQQLPPN